MTLPDSPHSLTPIPAWLTQPIESAIQPPVATRIQELPYHALGWQNFERLCLRLAQQDSAVSGCRLYGEQGDSQAGIDLYACEFGGEKYVVYQCKRVADFGPAKIKAAVDKFLEADGFTGLDQISTFVLCTMESLRGQQRDDMFREQEKVLRTRNIHLERWDADELDRRLKVLPDLVEDFFGRPWAEAFCSVATAQALGNPPSTPAFLSLAAFHEQQRRRDRFGFTIPYTRDGWDNGTSDAQQALRELVSSDALVALLTAPGGFGKTRLIVELGLWAENALKTKVMVVDPDVKDFVGHSRELPIDKEPLLILVDNAERIDLPALLNELLKSAAYDRIKVLALSRQTYEQELRRKLSPYHVMSSTFNPLPKLTFKESASIVNSQGYHGDDAESYFYTFSSGISLFLVLAIDNLKKGTGFSRLTTTHTPLDEYIDDQVQQMRDAGLDFQMARDVLKGVAWMRRIKSETPTSPEALANLTQHPVSKVRSVLQEGVRVGLLHNPRSGYQFAFDLAAERYLLLNVTPEEALNWLKFFNPLTSGEEGEQYAHLLTSTVSVILSSHSTGGKEYERPNALDELGQDFTRQISGLDPHQRFRFVKNVLAPMLPLDSRLALDWAGRLIRDYRPGEPIDPILGELGDPTYQLIRAILEELKRLLRVADFQSQTLSLLIQAGNRGGMPIQREVIALLKSAAKPNPFINDPLGGIEGIIEAATHWLKADIPWLVSAGLEILQTIAVIGYSDLVGDPDERLVVHSRKASLPLSWVNYQELYRQAQDLWKQLPETVVSDHAETIAKHLTEIIQQPEFRSSAVGSPEEAAFTHWVAICQELLPKLGVVHGRHLRKTASMMHRFDSGKIKEGAGDLVTLYDALAGAPAMRLIADPPTWLDYTKRDSSGHEEAEKQAREECLALTRQVITTTAPQQFSALVEAFLQADDRPNLSPCFFYLLQLQPEYAVEVYDALLKHTQWREKLLPLLRLFHHSAPEFVGQTLDTILSEDSEKEITLVLSYAIERHPDITQQQAEIARFANHRFSAVRATMAEWLCSDHALMEFAVRAVANAHSIDLEVGRGLLKGLNHLAYSKGVMPDLTQAFLEQTTHLPLKELGASGSELRKIMGPLAQSQPRWLMMHLEQRTNAYSEYVYGEAELFRQMFEEISSDPVVLTWMLERAWSWQQEDGWTLTEATAKYVFQKIALTDEALATQFLRDRIAESQQVPDLYDILSWIFQLPFGSMQDEIADMAILRAATLGATSEEWERLKGRVSSSVTNGRQFKSGPGPFPGDELLQRLAQKHLEAAEEKSMRGDLAANALENFWKELLDEVELAIKRTISEERFRYEME
ncbi:hypothetical protein [Deinococcus sp. PESE-13]